MTVDGRALKLSNWDKVLYPADRVHQGRPDRLLRRGSPRPCCPHLQDRPLTLKRYPNGVDGPYFYEKQSPSHRPDWVQTAQRRRRRLHPVPGPADARLAGQPGRHRAAHVALAGRRRPSRRRCSSSTSTPGRPAGIVECCEVALVLRGLFAAARAGERGQDLGLQGDAGVRAAQRATITYAQTKPFARQVAELLEQRLPELVVSRMTKRLRAGQGARRLEPERRPQDDGQRLLGAGARAPTVSAPVSWDEVQACHDEPGPRNADASSTERGARASGRGRRPVRDAVSPTRQRFLRAERGRAAHRRMGLPMDQIELRNRLLVATGMWKEATGEPLPRMAPGDPAAQIQELRAHARQPAVGERHARERAGDRRPHLGPGPRPAGLRPGQAARRRVPRGAGAG